MDEDEDDVDFFTRKPSQTRQFSRAKSSSLSNTFITRKPSPAAAALGEINETSPSTSKSPKLEEQRKRQRASSSDSESDIEIISSSEEEDTVGRRGRPKKKKPLPTLPRWSRGRSVSSESAEEADKVDLSKTNTANVPATKEADAAATVAGSPRGRDVSLTPPPEPSPDKLQAARALVEHVRAAHRNILNPSAGPETVNANGGDLDVLGEQGIDWDPEVAKLYKGDDAKQVRERAKREQELRRQKLQARRLLSTQTQSASDPSGLTNGDSSIGARETAFSRTVSAPAPIPSTSASNGQTTLVRATHDDGEDSDDSIQLVSGASAFKAPRRGDGKNASAAIALSDSDDDDQGNAQDDSNFHTPPGSPPSAEAANEDQGEIMSLTLSSSLGNMTVSVRPTVQLSKIVSHFVTSFRSESHPVKQRLPDSVDVSRIKIRFDGILFDPNPKPKPRSKAPKKTGTVADLDVEDGDQVEIVW